MEPQPEKKSVQIRACSRLQQEFGQRVETLCNRAIFEAGMPVAEVLGVVRWLSQRLNVKTPTAADVDAEGLFAPRHAALARAMVRLCGLFLGPRHTTRSELIGVLAHHEAVLSSLWHQVVAAVQQQSSVAVAGPEQLKAFLRQARALSSNGGPAPRRGN